MVTIEIELTGGMKLRLTKDEAVELRDALHELMPPVVHLNVPWFDPVRPVRSVTYATDSDEAA